MSHFRRWGVFAMVAAAIAVSRVACGYTLWTENAENGYGQVIDNTAASYPLIQSDIVGQGSSAFHLANPSFQDNSFVIDETLAIQPDTKLFFLSRLGWATSSQVARVQVSTNGGSSWSTNIYNQSGSGGSGEGGFSLKEIGLSSFASLNVRFRFLYDFTSGSAFTQIDPGIGWYVDDIQIGSELQKSQWSIGNPSAHAQQYLEYINRARANALTEASRLANETDSDIQDAYSFFGIQKQDIVEQFTWYVNNGVMDQVAQPLSFNAKLLTAAELHTQDMYQNQFQGHNSSNNPPAPFQPGYGVGQRLDAVGYDYIGAGENVYSNADSVAQGHAGFDVDWGDTSNPGDPDYNPAFNGQGMQNPAGHRRTIHNNDFKEVGIGVINGTNGEVGPQLVTQDLGNPGDIRYVTGVVYEELNSNSFYDIGEGRSGVRIDVAGSAYYAISSSSGGYSVPVGQDGIFPVTFTGGGFATFSTTASVTNGWNVKVDYLAAATILAGDYNNNGVVDAADYTIWRDTLGRTGTGLAADGDGDNHVDPDDYSIWKSNFGATAGSGSGDFKSDKTAVPEPTGGIHLWVSAAGLFFALRYRMQQKFRPESQHSIALSVAKSCNSSGGS